MNQVIRTFSILTAGMLVWAPTFVFAQDASPSISKMAKVTRDAFVSEASHIVATYQPKDVQRTVAARANAAKAFLQSLNDEQKKRALLPLRDVERREWTNLPAPANAGGVPMGELSEQQIHLACQLLATLMSDQGYRKMRDIMLADDQLLRNGKPRPGFGTENFSVVLFGTPSEDQPWAFQIDGHHVGVNLSIEGEKLTMSPSFIGTQPHRFKVGGFAFEPFQQETGLAHELATSLTDDQIRKAVLAPRRGRILTGPGNDGKVPPAKGVVASELDEQQRAILMRLISQWVNDLPKPLAEARMKEVKAELDQMYFSWNGNRDPGSDVSYRIQSPSLIIEYACQNLGGNPLDHLHSMYRNPKSEYLGQLK